MSVFILGIESSCDDTGASVIKDGQVLSNVIASQEIHRVYGGVVPEVASRAHQEHIVPVVETACKLAQTELKQLNAIAFTCGPGLIGSLIVGTSFAKGMATALDIPLIEVNHLKAHVLSHFIDDPKPTFPFLCLTVSGGHTQIVLVKDYLNMQIIGQTLDDAAGEAFDKSGKLLGLEYPAGPVIDKLATQGKAVFTFPEPQLPGLDFSFSGLKTAILYFVREQVKKNPKFIEINLADICASIQQIIAVILINKLQKAANQTGIRNIAIAGGVSANSELRRQIMKKGCDLNWNVFIPKMEYCTDNAAMIAITGYYKYLDKQFAVAEVRPSARLSF